MFGQILVNGLVLSGGYALVAVGLTLTFGVMRMVNFAEGQSVMIGAFVAYTAVPYVGYVGAIAAAMAVNAVLGIILERTAFRPFRGVELNGLIASMGMSIILVNIAELVWGTTPRPFETIYNETSINFGTVGISVQRLICVVASAAILLGLWWLVQYTSLGRKFRAVSEDHETAAAMGIDVNQVSRLALVIGSMMAASAGALTGPVNMIAPDMGRTEMLNAFAAIILGGFGNVNGTILGRAADRHDSEPRRGLHFECLFDLDRVRPAGADARSSSRAGSCRKGSTRMSRRILLIAAVAVLAALPLTFGAFWINMVITALIFSLAVFSINLLTGLTGLLSFGQAGFVGIGAYTLGVLAKQGHPPLLAGFYGVLLAMLCGFLLGLPAARLKGHYLAIGTLGFGILVYQLLTNSVDITRGPMGLIGIPTGGIDKQTWYLVMLCVCLAVLAALAYIDRYSRSASS